MVYKRFKYLLLIIFLGSILLIVFLQYNSGNSIKNLIKDNKSLLRELQVKSKLQKLETDIIFSESALRDMVANNDAQHIQDFDRGINGIQHEYAEIDSLIKPA